MKTLSYLLNKKLLVTLITLSCLLTSLKSQDFFNPFPCSNQLDLPSACLGVSYSIQFEPDEAVATWSMTSSEELELGINAAGVMNGTIDDEPTLAGVTHTITVTANFVSGSSMDHTFNLFVGNCSIGTLPILASPCLREIAFVIDASGSMNNPSSPGSSSTRWQTLISVLESQLPTMAATAGLNGNDDWKVISFNNRSTTDLQANDFLNNLDFTALVAETPSGGTPLGGGLQSSISNFFPGLGELGQGKRRVIILLTDGRQNQNPMVESTGLETVIDNDPGLSSDPEFDARTGLAGLPINLNSTHLNTVDVYAIGIGSLGTDAEDLLNDSFDDFESVLNPTAELLNIFTIQIVNALRNGSPRIVGFRKGNVPIGTDFVVEKFKINDFVKSLTFQLTPEEGSFSDTEIKIRKDGVLIPFEAIVKNQRQILIDFDFPYNYDNTSIISPKGEWTFEFKNYDTLKYQLTTFVDEKQIDFDLNFNHKKKFYVGENLPVYLKLEHLGIPIKDATVKATILKPGEDLGDLAANSNIPVSSIPLNEPQQSLGEAKLFAVANQLNIWESLQYVPSSISLSEGPDGIYSGTFSGFNNINTGNYRVVLEITGTHQIAGDFEAWEAKSAFFDFAKPDEIDLNEKFDLVSKNLGNFDTYQVTITPTNKFNKKIGPAQQRRIKLTSQQGFIQDFTDNLDGSYSARIQVPVGVEPEIDVFVIDKNKKVKTIVPDDGKGLGISLHYGIIGSFNNTPPLDTLSSGIFWEVDLSYQFNPKWAIGAIGGNYRMDESFDISGGGLFIQRSIPGTFITRFAIGAGGYQPSNQDWTYGVNGKLSFSRRFGPKLDVGIDGGILYLPDPDYQIWTLGAGVRYYF